MSRKRAFIYVQHLLGIGHFARAAVLASALAEAGLEVTVASGGESLPQTSPDRFHLAQLPPARAADLTFRTLIDARGREVDDAWRTVRRDALLAAFQAARPDVLIIELFPFGRRQMRFELLPLLDLAHARSPRPLVISSVRDIVGGGQQGAQRQADTVALVERYFDRVLVHGDPRVLSFERSFESVGAIEDRLHYTGYIVGTDAVASTRSAAGRDEVIVSAGGGAVGRRLLEAAVYARPLTTLANRTWRLLTGINAPAADAAMIRSLSARMGDGRIVVERSRRDFVTLMRNCAVSVSQAGYNTTMEILRAGTRAVLVPFADAAESEQSLRASALAAFDLVHIVDAATLGPQTLAAAIDRATRTTPSASAPIDLEGARRSASLIVHWTQEHAA